MLWDMRSIHDFPWHTSHTIYQFHVYNTLRPFYLLDIKHIIRAYITRGGGATNGAHLCNAINLINDTFSYHWYQPTTPSSMTLCGGFVIYVNILVVQ